MTGIGGSTPDLELALLSDMTKHTQPIQLEEFQRRIKQAQQIMQDHDIDLLYLDAGTNLYYFTGTKWYASERMVAALIPADGPVSYIAPHFEVDTLSSHMLIKGEVATWVEHECPYQRLRAHVQATNPKIKRIAIDENTPFFRFDGIKKVFADCHFTNAQQVTTTCRSVKSDHEIALLQQAKNMTLAVHQSTARILREGITTTEVKSFINQAHQVVGAPGGSTFCIVLFGPDTAHPHGVKTPKSLEKNDMVLIDTGTQVEGYQSDITRSYVFGTPSQRQREVWMNEKNSQAAAFAAAELGQPCSKVDQAARQYLTDQGFGPGYDLPGLPHRTGHGIGLDIHEGPYLVANDHTPLQKHMCFSNEPMICVPAEFGVRLEDHFYMTDSGPKWFTQPAHSIDNPFGH